MDAYYLSENGSETGPFAISELADMLRAGKISATSALRKGGSKDHFIAGAILRDIPLGTYQRPVLAWLLQIIATVWIVVGAIASFISARDMILGLASWAFTALILFGMAKIIDLVGRIEFNTRKNSL